MLIPYYSWVQHKPEQRTTHLPLLLEHVRLPLLSKDYLIETVQEIDLMKESDQRCKDFMLEALRYHLMSPEQKAKHFGNVSFTLIKFLRKKYFF